MAVKTGYENIRSHLKDPRLARYKPADMEHVAKYPLTARTMPSKPVPVVIGIDWYSNFDNPIKDSSGRYIIGKDPNNLGSIRGGHCVCIPHDTTLDLYSWWDFYNQGWEGACVGFGSSRAMSLLNRKRFNPWWLWDMAKLHDEWAETLPGDDNGTSVRAAMDMLRTAGHVIWSTKQSILTWEMRDALAPVINEGISANRWATTIDQLFEVLQNDRYKRLGMLPILNSWGRDYPHIVWMPCETHQKLMNQWGEYTLFTDR